MNRRDFLVKMGSSAALLSPILSSIRVEAAPNTVKNAVFLYSGNGIAVNPFRPMTFGQGFQPGYTLSPLMPYRDDVNVFFNMNAASIDESDAHIINQLLKAGGTISLDSYLADRRTTPVKALRLLIPDPAHLNNRIYDTLSFNNAGGAIACDPDPVSAYNFAFGGFQFPSGGGTTNPPPTQPSQILQQKKSILDFVLGDFNSMKKYLSKNEQTKFTENFDAVRRIETQLAAEIANGTANPPSPAPANPTCSPVTVPANAAGLAIDKRVPLLLDIIAAAIACGRTNVASCIMSPGLAANPYPFLSNRRLMRGSTLSFNGLSSHHLSHWATAGDAGEESEVTNLLNRFSKSQLEEMKTEIDKFHMEMMAYMIGRLKALGVFETTVVLWTTEFGGNHDKQNTPFVMAGGSGYFKNGQAFDMKAGGMSGYNHSSLLTAITHSMGNPMNIGRGGYAQAPLPQIVKP